MPNYVILTLVDKTFIQDETSILSLDFSFNGKCGKERTGTTEQTSQTDVFLLVSSGP